MRGSPTADGKEQNDQDPDDLHANIASRRCHQLDNGDDVQNENDLNEGGVGGDDSTRACRRYVRDRAARR